MENLIELKVKTKIKKAIQEACEQWKNVHGNYPNSQQLWVMGNIILTEWAINNKIYIQEDFTKLTLPELSYTEHVGQNEISTITEGIGGEILKNVGKNVGKLGLKNLAGRALAAVLSLGEPAVAAELPQVARTVVTQAAKETGEQIAPRIATQAAKAVTPEVTQAAKAVTPEVTQAAKAVTPEVTQAAKSTTTQDAKSIARQVANAVKKLTDSDQARTTAHAPDITTDSTTVNVPSTETKTQTSDTTTQTQTDRSTDAAKIIDIAKIKATLYNLFKRNLGDIAKIPTRVQDTIPSTGEPPPPPPGGDGKVPDESRPPRRRRSSDSDNGGYEAIAEPLSDLPSQTAPEGERFGGVVRGIELTTNPVTGARQYTTRQRYVSESKLSDTESLKRKVKKQKYKVVYTQNGKKVEIFASSIRGVRRVVYNKPQYRVFSSTGSDVTNYFKKLLSGKKS